MIFDNFFHRFKKISSDNFTKQVSNQIPRSLKENRDKISDKKFFHDFFKNDPYKGIIMREIDCAHS
jgi:hypothetical protein